MFRICASRFLKPTVISTLQTAGHSYTPRRAVLYVPGSDMDKITKALELDVDCSVLDCEDGVALKKKPEARKNIRSVLDKGKPQKKRKFDFAVRVNSPSTPLCMEDVKVLFSGKNLPDTILVPKIDTLEDVKLFSDHLDLVIQTKCQMGIVIMIESAMSLINCVEICKTAESLAKTSKIKPVALLFGSDDYCASIGASRSDPSTQLSYARQKIVAVAKAFNLQAIDMVNINFKDSEGCRKEAIEGANLGFTGKQVIHPDQVGIAQEVFMPSKEKVEWATTILTAFHKHEEDGKGAFSINDRMIDMPTVKQAQNVVDLINALMIQEKNKF